MLPWPTDNAVDVSHWRRHAYASIPKHHALRAAMQLRHRRSRPPPHHASERTTIGFAELEARANRLAHHFRRAGLCEGDTIALLMENNEHMHAVMWAARRVGLYYATINTT